LARKESVSEVAPYYVEHKIKCSTIMLSLTSTDKHEVFSQMEQ